MSPDGLLYLQFILGFFLLIKGADILVDGAVILAKRFQLSDMIVGLTVVSFGTSAPELAVNIIASLEGRAGLALGNVVGSNIANILLVLGISALVAPISTDKNTLYREIPMTLLSVFILALLVNDQFMDSHFVCENSAMMCNFLGRADAIILLLFFAFFMLYVYQQIRVSKEVQLETKGDNGKTPLSKVFFLIVAGLFGLVIGGDWIVKGSIHIAKIAGLSPTIIGITVVGIGTSLPEVATSAMAAYRGNAGLAIGNVLGSNLFNILWVLGLSALISPLAYDTSLNPDVMMMGLAILLLYLSLCFGKYYRLGRATGLFLLLVYTGYIVYLVSFSAV